MLGTSKHFKPTYTKEDYQELEEWFKNHVYHGDLNIGSGISMEDASESADRLLSVVMQGGVENRTYAGTMNLLYAIRDHLIAQGKVEE